ncbi:MAG: outer membrane beta-barrel protein [Prolixibacteraceae bacterium]|jgi:opacity protein-like surface antigen|nr:outer membrane beta-barrel protein [Prolixibacteraceae bacterium]
MKKIFYLFVLIFYVLSAYSQTKVGLEIGTKAFIHSNEIKYTNKTLSPGGNIGINVNIPIYSSIYFETGISAAYNRYRIRGDRYPVEYKNGDASSFELWGNFNNFSLEIPIVLGYKISNITPFLGCLYNYKINNNKDIVKNLYNIGYGYDYGKKVLMRGDDIISIDPFEFSLCGGFSYDFSNSLKVKLQYTYGLTDYVTHTITLRELNGVKLDEDEVYSTNIQSLKISATYYPNWKQLFSKKEGDKHKQFFKAFY